MELAIQTAPIGGSLAEKFAVAAEVGASAVNLGTCRYFGPGGAELPPEDYLDDPDAQRELLDLADEYGVDVGLIGGGNNPLHPDSEVASRCREELVATIRLADQLGVETVSCHSGLPGASPEDATPNWLTMPIPPEPHLEEAYRYQWEEVAIPYWREAAELADDHGVDLALEPHVNNVVHTPGKLLRLREATNDRLGAKLDPVHMLLQGIDEVESIRHLGREDAIHAFEASDVKVYESNARLQGLLDVPHAEHRVDRSWTQRAVGYGHGADYWRDLLDTLDAVGFDGVLTVQHLRTPEPLRSGFEDAVSLLEEVRPDT